MDRQTKPYTVLSVFIDGFNQSESPTQPYLGPLTSIDCWYTSNVQFQLVFIGSILCLYTIVIHYIPILAAKLHTS